MQNLRSQNQFPNDGVGINCKWAQEETLGIMEIF